VVAESHRVPGRQQLIGIVAPPRPRDLALAPRGSPPAPTKTLYCYSPSLMPTPADWPPDAIATGYWLRDDRSDAEPLNPDLESFGRRNAHDLHRFRQQRRARFGPSGRCGEQCRTTSRPPSCDRERLGAFPTRCRRSPSRRRGDDSCRSTRGASHDHLPLPGRPALLGAAAHWTGAGPQPMPAKSATPRATCIGHPEARDDGDMRTRASELSMGIAGEDGTGRASEQIESTLT
jgi:sterol 3beta-glucosyltransferase